MTRSSPTVIGSEKTVPGPASPSSSPSDSPRVDAIPTMSTSGVSATSQPPDQRACQCHRHEKPRPHQMIDDRDHRGARLDSSGTEVHRAEPGTRSGPPDRRPGGDQLDFGSVLQGLSPLVVSNLEHGFDPSRGGMTLRARRSSGRQVRSRPSEAAPRRRTQPTPHH